MHCLRALMARIRVRSTLPPSFVAELVGCIPSLCFSSVHSLFSYLDINLHLIHETLKKDLSSVLCDHPRPGEASSRENQIMARNIALLPQKAAQNRVAKRIRVL